LSATNSTSGFVRPDTYGEGIQADSGVTLIANTNTKLTGTSSFSLLLNSAKKITTTNLTTGSVQNIKLNLIGPAALTESTSPNFGDNDDGYWSLTLPFNIQFAGITTNTIYPGTNTYITFGSGSNVVGNLSASNPPHLKIMISCEDNSCQRLYYGTEGSSPNRTYRIRYEGTNSINGQLGIPNIVYEAIFYEGNPNEIDIHVGSNARITATGPTSYDAAFSGTSSACPLACGLIATKLQHNRSWTWQDVKNWLKNSVGDADTSQFDVGVESTSANDSNWQYVNSLEGGRPIVIWDALTGNEPIAFVIAVSNTNPIEGESILITISTDPSINETYYYNIEEFLDPV
jgi:hypothetical protein